MQIIVRMLHGKVITLDVEYSDSVESVKAQIHDRENIPTKEQRLILQGRELENKKNLNDYNIQKNTTLHLLGAPAALNEEAFKYTKLLSNSKEDILSTLEEIHNGILREENRKFVVLKHVECKLLHHLSALLMNGPDDVKTKGAHLLTVFAGVHETIPHVLEGGLLKMMLGILHQKTNVAVGQDEVETNALLVLSFLNLLNTLGRFGTYKQITPLVRSILESLIPLLTALSKSTVRNTTLSQANCFIQLILLLQGIAVQGARNPLPNGHENFFRTDAETSGVLGLLTASLKNVDAGTGAGAGGGGNGGGGGGDGGGDGNGVGGIDANLAADAYTRLPGLLSSTLFLFHMEDVNKEKTSIVSVVPFVEYGKAVRKDVCRRWTELEILLQSGFVYPDRIHNKEGIFDPFANDIVPALTAENALFLVAALNAQLNDLANANKAQAAQIANLIKDKEMQATQIANHIKDKETQAAQIANLIKDKEIQATQIANHIKDKETQATQIADLTKNNKAQATQITILIKDKETQATQIANLIKDKEMQAAQIANLTKNNKAQATQIAKIIKDEETQATQIANHVKDKETQATQIANLIKDKETQATQIANLIKQNTELTRTNKAQAPQIAALQPSTALTSKGQAAQTAPLRTQNATPSGHTQVASQAPQTAQIASTLTLTAQNAELTKKNEAPSSGVAFIPFYMELAGYLCLNKNRHTTAGKIITMAKKGTGYFNRSFSMGIAKLNLKVISLAEVMFVGFLPNPALCRLVASYPGTATDELGFCSDGHVCCNNTVSPGNLPFTANQTVSVEVNFVQRTAHLFINGVQQLCCFGKIPSVLYACLYGGSSTQVEFVSLESLNAATAKAKPNQTVINVE